MRIKAKKRRFLSASRWISYSFLTIILIGSLLLCLPIANIVHPKPYIDNLFVATSAVCVTGLTPVTLKEQYSLFGQLIIILLVQIGGLGFATFLYLALFMLKSRISLHNRVIFQEALSQDDLSILPRLLKTVFFWTIGIELTGALFFAITFIPEYGIIKGIYFGLWHGVSGFCNAGFDLLGDASLIPYATHGLINANVCFLIITGGIGFRVVLDIYDTYRREHEKKVTFHFHAMFKSFALHTKIVLVTTALLLLSGTLLFLALEYDNPATIGAMPFADKLLVSIFQSTTTRTAGFATVQMADLTRATKIVMCLFMLIGGSPASTAGGIKTVTFALCLLMIMATVRGQDDVVVFNRRIKKRIMLQALSIFAISLSICVIALIFMIMLMPQADVLDLMMEVFSAFGTVGLSCSLTPTLCAPAKMIIIILMYTGRIGPMSMMILFIKHSHSNKSSIQYPDEDVLVG